MTKKYAYAELPRTGFCNMLNPWARAFLWARDNHAQMIAPEWTKLGRIGPWIRHERDKRFYLGMVSNEGYVSGWRKWCILHFDSKSVKRFAGQGKNIADFPAEHGALLKELMRIAPPTIRSRLSALPKDYVAVHIRRGDFKTFGRTLPAEYYVRAIELAVERCNSLPILIFSDAPAEELEFLKKTGELYSRIKLMPSASALHDVLALSQAKVMVCTNGSSFSEWSAFLGQMPSIWSNDAFPIDPIKVSPEITLI